jgi:hypothetical protein
MREMIKEIDDKMRKKLRCNDSFGIEIKEKKRRKGRLAGHFMYFFFDSFDLLF